MKMQLKFFLLIALGFGLLNTVFAQRGHRNEFCNNLQGLQLNDAQKKQVDELRTPFRKKMLEYKNQLNELRAQLRTLETADKADMKAIDAKIDEIAKKRTAMAKTRAAHKQDVRKILTEEQRLEFDTHKGKGHHMKRDFRKGRKRDAPCQQK